jgi:hypothetical protein
MEKTDLSNETIDALMKVLEARRQRKESLKGIERMKWNLCEKLSGWMMREDGYRVVCVSEIVDKVKKYAPKAILRSRAAFVEAVEMVWGVTGEYTIASDDDRREDLEFELSYIFK